jgi:hypothetical protein
MKHVFFFLTLLLSISNTGAQNKWILNPASFAETESSYNYLPQANDEITLTWLTRDDETQQLGYNGAGDIAVFMEFYPEDVINYKGSGKRPAAIKQIQFHLSTVQDWLSKVSSCRIIIRQGESLGSSVEVVNQEVTDFTGGWNLIDLTENYVIDANLKLYIGYQLTQTEPVLPFSITDGNTAKQAWVLADGYAQNLTDQIEYVFLIKAIATTEDAPEAIVTVYGLTIPQTAVVGDEIPITGFIRNMGTATITSFTLAYTVDGTASSSILLDGLNVAPNSYFSFTHSEILTVTESKEYVIRVIPSKPNGDDNGVGFSKSTVLDVYAGVVPHVLLHENFTSSTCSTCYTGNQILNNILDASDETKWVNIRYQVNWPAPGDPYYTEEGGIRENYYAVDGHYLLVDGGRYNNLPRNYSKGLLDELAIAPAVIDLSGTAETVSPQTVNAEITLKPLTNVTNPNLRLFAAVVEKTTTQNQKGSGETVFRNIMKKFLTSPNGNRIADLEAGVTQKYNLSHTFKGDYRLPSSSFSSINHIIEHSIENFGNLMVVFWVQDIETKKVYQAGKADAPSSISGLNDINSTNTAASIHDGYLHIHSDVPVRQVDIYTVSGQKVVSAIAVENTVPVAHLAPGVYVVKWKTSQGEKVVKIDTNR